MEEGFIPSFIRSYPWQNSPTPLPLFHIIISWAQPWVWTTGLKNSWSLQVSDQRRRLKFKPRFFRWTKRRDDYFPVQMLCLTTCSRRKNISLNLSYHLIWMNGFSGYVWWCVILNSWGQNLLMSRTVWGKLLSSNLRTLWSKAVGEKCGVLRLPFCIYCVVVSMVTGNHSADRKECVSVFFRFARSSLSFTRNRVICFPCSI